MQASSILAELFVEFPRGVSCGFFFFFLGPFCIQLLEIGRRLSLMLFDFQYDIWGRTPLLKKGDLNVLF